MTKSNNDTMESVLARLDALEKENAELRAARHGGGSPFDVLVDRIEQTAPALALKKMNERTAQMQDAKAREIIEAWRGLLEGERPFLFSIFARSRFGNDVTPRPNMIGFTGLLVFSSDELTAQRKYFDFQGVNYKNPPAQFGTFRPAWHCTRAPISSRPGRSARNRRVFRSTW